MKRGIRKKEGEDLSEATIEKVINLLNQEKPITKKEACEILNISYNTTRLNRIIEEYKELLEYRTRRRKELRNAPLTDQDISEILSTYLETGNLTEIAESTFRSTSVIKGVLEKYNIPLRSTEYDYFNPPLLDDTSIQNDYTKDDLVYSARYTHPAKERKQNKHDDYRNRLLADLQYALQPYWELGDLREVQKNFEIDTPDRHYWTGDQEILRAINLALTNAKKRKKSE